MGVACSWQRQSSVLGGVFFERHEVDSGHVVAVLILDLARHHGPVLGDPCTRCLMEALRTDLGENLLLARCQGR